MIRNKNLWPPGGWLYRESIGKFYLNIADMSYSFEAAVKAIRQARTNNPSAGLPTSYESCAEALTAFTCKRLGYDARWCVNPNSPVAAVPVKRKCAGCGRKKKK